MLVQVLFKHLETYKPVMANVDQEEDAVMHVNECISGKAILARPIPATEYRQVIMNLTRLVDAEDKKIDERKKTKASVEQKKHDVPKEHQLHKNATATRLPLVVAPVVEQVEVPPIKPKKTWSCFPCWQHYTSVMLMNSILR